VRQPHRLGAGWDIRWAGWFAQSAEKRGHRRRWLSLEPLESRRLLTSVITEYPALSSGTNGQPTQLTMASDGNIWFSEPAADEIGIFNLTSDDVSDQIGTTVGNPTGITGTNGNIWFTINAPGQLGQMTVSPPGGYLTHDYQYGPPDPSYAAPAGITSVGSDVWITVPAVNNLEVYDPSVGFLKPYSLAPANIDVTGFNSQIVAGPGGNLWFTEPGAIGIFSTTSDTVIGQVSLPTSGGTQMPAAITVGPNNTIWFTESVPSTGTSAVGVINATTQQYITEFTTPDSSEPDGITEGSDGNIWFTESAAGAIGVVDVNSLTDPTQDTLGTPIPIPTRGQTGGVVTSPHPVGITAAPGGVIWFADSSGAIGVFNPLSVPPHLAVTTAPPISVTAGTGFGLTVTAEYSASDLDTGFDGSVAVAVASGPSSSLGGTLTATAANGVATFSGLSLGTAGNYSLVASSTATGGPTSVTTSSFTVVNAPGAHFTVTTEPTSPVTAGSRFEVAVTDEYASGATDTLFTGSVSLALSSDLGTPIATVSAIDGVATFTNVTVDTAGNGYTIQATGGGLAAVSTNPFNVVPAAATQLFVTPSLPGSILFNSPFGLTVALLDPYNNVETAFNGSVSVAIAPTSNPGGGTLSGTTIVTASQGVANFSGFSINRAGTGYELQISGDGLTNTTNAFNITGPVPTVVLAQIVTSQKHNKKGKPVGKPVFAGFAFEYSTSMSSAAALGSDYVVDTMDTITIKQGKHKKKEQVAEPIAFSTTYNQSTNTVTLNVSAKQKFSNGGQITIVGSPPGGVASSVGVFLNGGSNDVYTINKKAKGLTPG
jgi:streptogramin lyase